MAGKVSIILVENTYLLRAGMEQLLQELKGVRLADSFDSSEKNLADKVNRLKPDFLLLNPKAIPPPVTAFILSLDPDIKLVGLRDENTPAEILGKFPFLLNINDSKYELLKKLHDITGQTTAPPPDETQPLSEREITILKHITRGMTNQEIAEKLFLSVHTVTTHRKNITKKLGIKTVAGLTVYALLHKIIDMEELK